MKNVKLKKGGMLIMKKGKSREKPDIDFGLGSIFKGFGSFLDILSEMAEKGDSEIKREGEISSKEKGFKAVYGFSVKIGGEGRPLVEHFGNIREDKEKGPVVDEVREPIVDVFDEGNHLVVVAELPGVDEKDIKYELKDDILIISAETGNKKYYKETLLPTPVNKEKISSSYRNGIFEMKLWK